MWMVLVTVGETGAHIPYTERAVGPFRSEQVAERTCALIQGRIDRHIARGLAEHDAAAWARVLPLRNDAARHHYNYIADVATERFLRFDPSPHRAYEPDDDEEEWT